MKKADSVTYIGFIQDHSGSMKMLERDINAIANFNEQRAKLLKEDDDTMDNLVIIVEFDDQIYCNIENIPIADIKELDKWWTGGMTALYDAIAYCINNIKKKMDADERKDNAALVVIQTDGGENHSSGYEGEEGRIAINKMINELEETGLWTFVFLGENIDKEVAMDIGFKAGNIMSFKTLDTKQAYACSTSGLGEYMKARKRGVTQSMNYFDGNDIKNENTTLKDKLINLSKIDNDSYN